MPDALPNGRATSPATASRPAISFVAPNAAPEEAAAVVAALERFLAETAPAPTPAPTAIGGWTRAALLDGVRSMPGPSPAAPPWSG